jgi:hypothetical protein
MRTALCLPLALLAFAPGVDPTPSPRPAPSQGPAAIVIRGSDTVPTDFTSLATTAGTLYGASVAVDGDVAILGVPGNEGGAPGEARVARRETDGTWTERCTIFAPAGGTGNFGASVALLGTTAVVGAPRLGTAGAAYLVDLSGTSCGAPSPLTLPAGLSRAGASVAISADWIAVGAPGADGTPLGGAVAVFARADLSAVTLRPPSMDPTGNLFGASVAIAADSLLVGAPNAGEMEAGAVFASAYDRGAGTPGWSAPAMQSVGEPMARLGASVALNAAGTVAALGAPGAAVAPSVERVGRVVVLTRTVASESWPSSGVVLSAEDDADASDDFGAAVAVDGTDVVVGARYDEEDGRMKAGAVYHFVRRGEGYARVARYVHDEPLSTANADEALGYAVAASGGHVLAGAPGFGAPRMTDRRVGVVLAFRRPALLGEACGSMARCETDQCFEGVCCQSDCSLACFAGTCGADGACLPDNGTECMTECGTTSTCMDGACVPDEGCDSGPAPLDAAAGEDAGGEDAGAFDAGARQIVRVSGCKCAVAGARRPGPLALGALALLGLALAARRRGSRRGLRRSVAGGALLLALTLAAPARAQDTVAPSETEVQTLLTEALREFEGGNYTEAYALFRRLHELAPSARTERGLGNTAFELRRYVEAIDWLEQSLADTRRPLTDELRAQVETLLVRARAFVGHFTIRSNVPGAQLAIDGEPLVGDARSLEVGEHTLEARAAGYETLTRRITVRGGEDETVELLLIATPVAAAGAATAPAEDPGALFRDLGVASLIAGGVSVVGGAIATAFWASNVGALNANLEAGNCYADAGTESVIPGGPAFSLCLEQQNRYRLALPFAWTGFVAGAALLGAGLGLFVGAPSADAGSDAAASALRCGPFAEAGVSCVGSF